ncbi:MAG: hypothetical protein DI598_11335 [Pseudopedobacter saltans]|uniref:HipA-like kinase domain-containing protein n=1 Tax=Pseudopedobacter saltans TaxID=151895 RepID=A0A2W5EV10_9SPHI|nr:MAG: hypothetical protein DI598_11335 [Pseudopedobacter saltans]
MDTLYSIQTADKLFDTNGSRPILIGCNDGFDYVTKYRKNSSTPYRLFSEYLSICFLDEWHLPIPSPAIIEVKWEHIPTDWYGTIRKIFVDMPCFGLKYLPRAVEVTDFTIPQKVNASAQYNLLKTALFDIWLSNEDRNGNNYNLLWEPFGKKFLLIDHEGIFNTGTWEYPISVQTEQDSLISTELFKQVFKHFIVSTTLLSDLKNDFYLCIRNCQSQKDKIIQNIPKEWLVNSSYIAPKVDEIFRDSWLQLCWNTFCEYIMTYIGS